MLSLLTFLFCFVACTKEEVAPPSPITTQPNVEADTTLSYLALGDSYTIGTSVAAEERWPNQLAQALLEKESIRLEPLEIVARNGWRTDNLSNALHASDPGTDWQLVSLLIGVNDQYQGFNVDGYRSRFRALLESAIRYAGGDTSSVFVVSIPDYAYTPFGGGGAQVSADIDAFNAAAEAISISLGVPFYDIVAISREGLKTPALVAEDDLHPSGLQYRRWVDEVLLDQVAQQIRQDP
ncbi:SGNH/GDSL hydrolase family protein [Lewinella sp. IMCC34191]|uniref:SGNH/GDSL hydrolase family protein n=1 Tax=Lewinella sp. IMCC34191 TaxID=2259172 RepID=UPI0018E59FB6|nr:SGNH/GDSL hydrolase family protein [Lewinella sp. IMCC34191]